MRCCRVVFQMRFLVCLFRAIGVRLTLSVRLLVVALICIGFLVDVLGSGGVSGMAVGRCKVLAACWGRDLPGWIAGGQAASFEGHCAWFCAPPGRGVDLHWVPGGCGWARVASRAWLPGAVKF